MSLFFTCSFVNALPVHNTTTATDYATIQSAVTAANAGDNITVDPGTYIEQVEIDKNLSITGIGSVTIMSPAILLLSYTTNGINKAIVFVHDAANVVLKNLRIDGDGQGNLNNRFQGIGFWNAGGTVQDCEIEDVRNTPIDGSQAGVGLYAFADNGTARTLNVIHNYIHDFQKNATSFSEANLTVNIDKNIIRGAGPINYNAQNGIVILNGATGTITNNKISDFSYTPATFVSCGILAISAGGSVLTKANTVNNSQVGVFYSQSSGTINENVINYIAGNMGSTPYWYGINVEDGTATVNSNEVNGGGNGAGIEADYSSGQTTNMSASNNKIDKTDEGFSIYTDGSGGSANTPLHLNSITNSVSFAIHNYGTSTQDARCNWYGTTISASVAAMISGPVTYVPFLNSGTDVNSATGFQPAPNTCSGGCPGGSVVNVNTGITYCTIQAAIDDPLTLNGHVIKASAGTYTENVNVTKQVTIKGNNAGVDGYGSRAAESVVDANLVSAAFAINESNVTIDGFTIINAQNGLNAGIWMNASKGNNKILNNIIRNNAIGVYANCASASLIQDNLFNANNLTGSSSGTAIYAEYTNYLTVNDNEIKNHTLNNPVLFAATGAGVHKYLTFNKNRLHDNTYGVYVISVSNGKFTNNTFDVSSATCLAFTGACTSNSVKNNFFKGSYRAVRVENDGFGYGANSNISVNENSFTKTFSTYILLSGSYTPASLNATCNWYETTTESAIAPKITGAVTFKPYLTNGTDNSTSTPGFQPVPNSCNGPVTCNLSGGNISMSPSTPVPGQKSHTIYRGYGPTCATLTPSTVSGGATPYTYKWSTGSTSKSISACPTSTTTYTLTIKDAKGCQLVKTFKITVIDARCGPNKDRVLICVNGSADCDTKEQAKQHLEKGDKLGPCSAARGEVEDAVDGEDVIAPELNFNTEQTVNVFPNPSTGNFKVKLENYDNTETEIAVVDVTGRLIEKRKVSNGLQTQVIDFNLKNIIPGMYFVRTITKEGVKTQKVVIQK